MTDNHAVKGRLGKLASIPDELERVSHNVAALTVAVTALAIIAVAISLLALGRTRRGH